MMTMNYKNPKQSGFNASISGMSNLDCPANYRTQANARALWMDGWEAGERSKSCKGIQLDGPNDRSGCGMKSGIYPMGDCPECA
jgi:ribosome modulation factor